MPIIKTPPPGGGKLNKTVKKDVTIEGLTKKLEEMEQMCAKLSLEVNTLKAENLKLKSIEENKIPNSENKAEFSTDEEELAKETEWILKKRPAKKRKAEYSPALPEKADKAPSKPLTPKNSSRPPPIMVSGDSNGSNYQQLYTIAKSEEKTNFTIKLLNNGIYKLNTFSVEDYRSISKALSSRNISWYSFENKQTRAVRVIIKNLHNSYDPKSIINDLKEQGLNALSAVNRLKWKDKTPLDMFLVTFDPMEDIKKIYETKTILNSIVSIEPVKLPKLIPQCKHCQSFGHTQNYCGKQPRCVKCSGKHKTSECSKPEQQQPKCCNCGEAHPANYRGCLVAKELQKLRAKTIGHKKTDGITRKVEDPADFKTKTNEQEGPKITAETLKKSTFAHVLKANNNENISNNSILSQILQKLNKQEEFNTSLQSRLCRLEKYLFNNKDV